MNKKNNLIFFSICLLFIISFIQLYNEDRFKKNIDYCYNLDYEKSLILHPKNFSKFNIELTFPSERSWKEVLLKSEIDAKKYEGKYGVRFYEKSKRVKGELIITLPNKVSCKLLANIRPHGLLKDHRDGAYFLPSLNISLDEGNIFGITKFILFRPYTRSWDNEIIVSTLLNELNYLSPRTSRVSLQYDNNRMEFIFQEKIAKEFLEINNVREGPLYEGENKQIFYFGNYSNDRFYLARHKVINERWSEKSLNNMNISEEGLSILNRFNEGYIENLKKIHNLPSDYYFLDTKLDTEYFSNFQDYDSLNFALRAEHGLSSDDRVYYFDAFYKKFFPVYWDGTPFLLDRFNNLTFNERKQIIIPSVKSGSTLAKEKLINLDINNLLKKLQLYGMKIDLDELNKTLNYVKKNLNKYETMEENLLAPINYIKENEKIKKDLETQNVKIAFYDNEFKNFHICVYYDLQCEMINLNTKDRAKLISQEFEIDKNKVIFFSKTLKDKKWYFEHLENSVKPKIISINENINFKINGNVEFSIDKKNKKIDFLKKSKYGNVTFFKSNINNWKIKFLNENDTLYPGSDRENLTGCLNFYDSKLNQIELYLFNSNCEDSVNFVRTRGVIKHIEIKDSGFDSLDSDFSQLTFNSILVNNSKNDCLDFSYGVYKIINAMLKNCDDKAISAGELASLEVNNLKILNSKTGVASKDYAKVKIKNSKIYNAEICYEAYKKKQEFAGGFIETNEASCVNSKKIYSSDSVSKIVFNKI